MLASFITIIAVIFITKANYYFICLYVQVLGRGSDMNKHLIIIESMSDWTFKPSLPMILPFPGKFKFKEQVCTLMTMINTSMATCVVPSVSGEGI